MDSENFSLEEKKSAFSKLIGTLGRETRQANKGRHENGGDWDLKKRKGVGDGRRREGISEADWHGCALPKGRARSSYKCCTALEKSVLVKSKYHNSEQQGSFRLPEQITGPLFYFNLIGD